MEKGTLFRNYEKILGMAISLCHKNRLGGKNLNYFGSFLSFSSHADELYYIFLIGNFLSFFTSTKIAKMICWAEKFRNLSIGSIFCRLLSIGNNHEFIQNPLFLIISCFKNEEKGRISQIIENLFPFKRWMGSSMITVPSGEVKLQQRNILIWKFIELSIYNPQQPVDEIISRFLVYRSSKFLFSIQLSFYFSRNLLFGIKKNKNRPNQGYIEKLANYVNSKAQNFSSRLETKNGGTIIDSKTIGNVEGNAKLFFIENSFKIRRRYIPSL